MLNLSFKYQISNFNNTKKKKKTKKEKNPQKQNGKNPSPLMFGKQELLHLPGYVITVL